MFDTLNPEKIWYEHLTDFSTSKNKGGRILGQV